MAATNMPTTGRVTAAAAFAALSAAITMMAMPLLPQGLHAPNLPLWNALVGAACGHRIAGIPSDDGVAGRAVGAVARGLTAGAATAVVALFLLSGARMIELAMRHRYRGLLDALADTFDLMATYGAALAEPRIVGAAIAGSAAAGLLADAMQRRFT